MTKGCDGEKRIGKIAVHYRRANQPPERQPTGTQTTRANPGMVALLHPSILCVRDICSLGDKKNCLSFGVNRKGTDTMTDNLFIFIDINDNLIKLKYNLDAAATTYKKSIGFDPQCN